MIERNFILLDKRESGYTLSDQKVRTSYEVKLRIDPEDKEVPLSVWSSANNSIELEVTKEEFAKFKIGRKYKLVLTESE